MPGEDRASYGRAALGEIAVNERGELARHERNRVVDLLEPLAASGPAVDGSEALGGDREQPAVGRAGRAQQSVERARRRTEVLAPVAPPAHPAAHAGRRERGCGAADRAPA